MKLYFAISEKPSASVSDVTEQQTASSSETMSVPTNAAVHLGMKQEALGTTFRHHINVVLSVASLQNKWKNYPLCSNIAAKLQEEVGLFFREPQQLLSIFTDLEDENLGLIQKCQG